MGRKTFPKITAYPKLAELQKRLLSGESVLKIKGDLDKERYHVSTAYLRQYKSWLEDIKNNQQDEILLELERKGLLQYVNEVSFLKAIVAGSFKNLDMKEISLSDGLKAASLLIERELKLPKNQGQKIQNLMAQFISVGEPPKVQDMIEANVIEVESDDN